MGIGKPLGKQKNKKWTPMGVKNNWEIKKTKKTKCRDQWG